MSEITRGAIGMPFEMAMESELSRRQFHSIAQALLAEREQLKAENAAALREATDLTMAIWRRCYAKDSPNFQPFEKASSVIGQIDNMAAGLMSDLEKLRAEIAGLKTGYEAYERVNAELKAEVEGLRKDKDRLDALESNFRDVRHDSHPIADTGDSSSSLEIVGHWMDKPFERVIGEDWNENLRAAIDQAMKAPAYPPARPEYPEFDDIPDFSPGNGNSARRRAASLGIDYDAALGRGEQS